MNEEDKKNRGLAGVGRADAKGLCDGWERRWEVRRVGDLQYCNDFMSNCPVFCKGKKLKLI